MINIIEKSVQIEKNKIENRIEKIKIKDKK